MVFYLITERLWLILRKNKFVKRIWGSSALPGEPGQWGGSLEGSQECFLESHSRADLVRADPRFCSLCHLTSGSPQGSQHCVIIYPSNPLLPPITATTSREVPAGLAVCIISYRFSPGRYVWVAELGSLPTPSCYEDWEDKCLSLSASLLGFINWEISKDKKIRKQDSQILTVVTHC